MFSIREPSVGFIRDVVAAQSNALFNYNEVGQSRDSETPPRGYRANQWRSVIGRGESDFERAITGIQQLRMLNLGWIRVVPAESQLEANGMIATLARCLGVYALQVARVVYIIDEVSGTKRRFGFGYGTLPEHPMRGEERFTASMDTQTGEVVYEIYSFSRPSTMPGKLGVWYLRHTQKRFCRESATVLERILRT